MKNQKADIGFLNEADAGVPVKDLCEGAVLAEDLIVSEPQASQDLSAISMAPSSS
jgi:hypothetical protein